MPHNVAYVYDEILLKLCDTIPAVKNRASMIHSLIESLGILEKVTVVQSKTATEEEIRSFHSEEYTSLLKDSSGNFSKDEEYYGLGFDCPIIENIWKLVLSIAGSSLTASDYIIAEKGNIAINWIGGWHHAQRDSASGFCYVNDVVLAIQRLRIKFDKVLYIDLDVHHGDGVENAFCFTPKVLTMSLHKYEPGFFPGTGDINFIGMGKGKFYTVNIPYEAGIDDEQFAFIFDSCVTKVLEKFCPDAIVVQCGADALSKDPVGGGNVTIGGYVKCIQTILSFSKPLLILGGGGYNASNTARLWATITALLVNKKLPEDIPEHKFFELYGPDFTMEVSKSLRKSSNNKESLNSTIENVIDNLENIKL